MVDREYFRKLTSTGIILALLVLSFFLLKPFLLVVVFAFILAFLFYPLYLKLKKVFRSGNLAAFVLCLVLATIILIPIWFLTPILLRQSLEFFVGSQQIDFITPLSKIFPNLFASEAFSREIGSTLSSFIIKLSGTLTNIIADVIRNFPVLVLKSLIMFFTFFVALKDQQKFLNYVKSLLPFSKDIENKLFKSSRGITISVLYGQVVLGIFQGLLVGAALFIFGIQNALLLTIIACIAGIFPIVGTTIVWIPLVFYLFSTGEIISAIGITGFGLIASTADNFVKPIFISRRIDMHPALVLLGMFGGLFLFGIMGIILGPLILAYLFIILEIYRSRKVPGVFTQSPVLVKNN